MSSNGSSSSSSSSRTRRATQRTRENGSTSSLTDLTASGRSLRQAERKAYYVDNDNDDEIEEIKAPTAAQPSPNKRSTKANGFASRTSSSKLNLDNVAKLESITGLSRAEAIELLEACEHSVEKAIEIHFSGEISSNPKSLNGKSVKSATKRTHKDITDADMKEPISISDDSNSQGSHAHKNVYESGDDNVRAPIAPTIERLVDYDPYGLLTFCLLYFHFE